MKIKPPSTKCERCHWPYPQRLLSPMQTSQVSTGDICGICALALKNETHGTSYTEFSGPYAENLRQEALSWRARHADLAPKDTEPHATE